MYACVSLREFYGLFGSVEKFPACIKMSCGNFPPKCMYLSKFHRGLWPILMCAGISNHACEKVAASFRSKSFVPVIDDRVYGIFWYLDLFPPFHHAYEKVTATFRAKLCTCREASEISLCAQICICKRSWDLASDHDSHKAWRKNCREVSILPN